MQLRLLTQVCRALTSVSSCDGSRPPWPRAPRLGDLMSILVGLSRIHYGRADTSRVDANLPLLHFTQVTWQALQ